MPRKTRTLTLLLLLACVTVLHAQDGTSVTSPVWTWVGGSQGKVATAPSFGTQGVPSSSNFPGSQSEATTWTDASGDLWLFGGSQSDSSGTYGSGNDLWRYSPSTSQWTWMGGGTIDATNTAEGNYGTLGVAAASNLPPGRVGAVGWTDASGNFWLFGGTAFADISSHYETVYYNDLWKYNPTSNQWTWMGGSDTPTSGGFASGVFGTKGTASTANIPSSRYGSVSWTDNNGDLWLMGGSGVDSTGLTAMLNDLWRYSPTTGQWTWITGNSVAGINNGLSGTTSGAYGSEGEASTGNTPGGRFQGASWIDTSGNFWLFGGWGSDSTGTTGLLNDLWEYSPSANTWMWVSGGDTLPPRNTGLFQASAGVYGTQGTASASNVPGGRYVGAAWTDASGNFWLFGGVGADSTDTDGLLNDVWVFSPTSNQWTWMGGSTTANATAVYGTEGVASASNTPGSRAMMLYWTDLNHNLWLFGGLGGSYQPGDPSAFTYTDLWTAGTAGGASSPAVTLSQTALSFVSSAGTASSPQMVTLTNSGTGSLTIIGISLTGANGSSFAETNNCPASLAANDSCTISITFTPATATSYSASLSITDNATGSPQTVTLTGTGATAYCVNNPATPYVNCNPGGAVIGSNSQSQQLSFATPVVTTATASAFSTEIVGTYNGTTVYDQTFAAAYGTPTVQAGVTAANAAIATAGGSNAVIPAPALTSTSSNTSTSSSSIYSVAQPEASTTVITSTTTTTFGPATIMAQVANLGNPANPTAAQTSICNVSSLPSATMPTCMATNAGTLTVLGGQEDINTNIDNNYLINTATTSTTTTTTDAVYSINATAATSAPNPDDLDWTWMDGSSLVGSSTHVAPGNYGTLGVPASTNVPLGRVGPGTWTDKSGNFWMMGGSSISESMPVPYLNDLWEYSPSTLEWTWQGGANSVPAGTNGVGDTFGTQGTPSAQTIPGARSGALTWTDPSGNLWLYGGYGVDAGYPVTTASPIEMLYSFWKYTPSSGQWTWIAGSDYGIPADVVNSVPTYGVMGIPSSANFPGARSGGSTWTDSAGDLWMFGGDVVNAESYTTTNGFGESAIDGNDLWKFDPTSQQWTWEAGSQITSSASVNPNCTPGVNGTLGQPAAGITPSGRGGSSSWTDSAGNLWLFGGQGCGSFNINAAKEYTWGTLNDLWKFSTTTNEWTWVAGGTSADQSGIYGTLGTPAAGNTPGEREDAYSWTDKNGKFWLFGGSGYDSNGIYGAFNDLWMFDPSTTEWTWEGGSTTDSGSASLPGIYGTLGVGAAGNMPGARDGGGAWTDTSGNLWLFGGLGEDASGTLGDLNDLWEYGSGAVATQQAATPTFSVTGGNYSSAQSVTISDATPNATIYYTIDGTTPTTGSTVYSGTAITVSSTETIEAIATASGYTQSATATATYTITVQAKTTPTVTVSPSPASVTTAQALPVTITVSGTPTPTGSVTLSSGTYTSGSVTLTNGAATISIPAGALTTGTDTLTATYTPDANSSTTFTSASGTNTVTVTAAVVTAPVAALTPAGPLTFTAASGSTSAAQTATLTNTGNAALSITGIGITGTNASSFAETNTCGSSLAEGVNCSISITFSPGSAASFTASLSVADNASGSPQTIALNGTGTTSTNPTATFILSSLTSTGTVSDTIAATYQLTVTPQNGAFTSPISLSASGVPSG